jgi:hypothetical protein
MQGMGSPTCSEYKLNKKDEDSSDSYSFGKHSPKLFFIFFR